MNKLIKWSSFIIFLILCIASIYNFSKTNNAQKKDKNAPLHLACSNLYDTLIVESVQKKIGSIRKVFINEDCCFYSSHDSVSRYIDIVPYNFMREDFVRIGDTLFFSKEKLPVSEKFPNYMISNWTKVKGKDSSLKKYFSFEYLAKTHKDFYSRDEGGEKASGQR